MPSMSRHLSSHGMNQESAGNSRLWPLKHFSSVRKFGMADLRSVEAVALYLHHCFSHGMPSLFPSIFVSGQFFRK
jgi:hypothetical protein